MKLSDQLRRHLESSGLTMYAIAKQTGIDQASLGKFRHGERGLSWDAVDKLGVLLGLKIVTTQKRKSAPQTNGKK